jgi:hypothetical protein
MYIDLKAIKEDIVFKAYIIMLVDALLKIKWMTSHHVQEKLKLHSFFLINALSLTRTKH